MTDLEIINLITDNGRLKYISLRYINKIKKNNINLYNEIINRYKDADSIKEILYRLKNNIEVRPICKNCGGHILFLNDKGNRHWQEYCSQKCLHESQEHWNKCKETCKERYNDENFRNISKIKQTKLEKYGNENYINIDKSKDTRFKKYGKWNSDKASSIFSNRTQEEKTKHIQKSKQTKLERYGDENYVNSNKAKQTKLERYGDENYNNREKYKQTCLEKYGVSSFINLEKRKKTCLEKYGVECVFQSNIIKNKIKNTYLEKYGVDNILKIPEIRLKNNTYNSKESREKAKKTSIDRFGIENYNNREKAKKTCLERYGVSNKRKLEESKLHMSLIMKSNEIQEKRNNTLKINNSYNKSSQEELSYILLKEKYPNVIRQYRSELYPFNCDFYIPSLDLYIECHYSQFHYKHLFDKTNKDDLLYLEELKEKANKSERHKIGKESQYDKMIYTWTDLDVRKQQIAQKNNLNYLLFYNIDELKKWLKV